MCLFHFGLKLRDRLQKFIDRRVKKKFEYGLQIWFICGLAIGWYLKFPQRPDIHTQ